MPAPLLALAAIGQIAKSYGQYKAAKIEAGNMRERATASLLEAEEGLRRSEINIQATKREGGRFAGEQVAQYASSGVDIGSNATLSALEDTADAISDEILKAQTESAFEYRQRVREADALMKGARDVEKAGKIAALGGLAEGGAKLGAKGS